MASQNYTAQQAQINKKIEKLQKQALLLASKSRKPILNGLVRTMREYGISPAELAEAFGKSKASAKAGRPAKTTKTGLVKKPVAPKYRHPGSGATWTGRGKALYGSLKSKKMVSRGNSF